MIAPKSLPTTLSFGDLLVNVNVHVPSANYFVTPKTGMVSWVRPLPRLFFASLHPQNLSLLLVHLLNYFTINTN